MRKKLSCAVATASVVSCAVCQVWMIIQLLRVWLEDDFYLADAVPTASVMIFYMAAVCLFNWFAVTSGSRPYRMAAVYATAVHFGAGILQAVAAQAVVRAGEAGRMLQLGLRIPSVFNLPMNSIQVLMQPDTLFPWGTTMFFALNLAVVILRFHRQQEPVGSE